MAIASGAPKALRMAQATRAAKARKPSHASARSGGPYEGPEGAHGRRASFPKGRGLLRKKRNIEAGPGAAAPEVQQNSSKIDH